MRQLLSPLCASVLVGLGAPAQAQEQPPLGRINDTQLQVVGFAGWSAWFFLAPAAWYA